MFKVIMSYSRTPKELGKIGSFSGRICILRVKYDVRIFGIFTRRV